MTHPNDFIIRGGMRLGEAESAILIGGVSPDAQVQKWQQRLNWLQRRLGDNCHLDRNVRELVRKEPFGNVGIDEFYLERTPRTHGYISKGMARRYVRLGTSISRGRSR